MHNNFENYLNKMNILKNRILPDDNFKYHNHHIIPKFMGGEDIKENIVKLTIEEHIQAHLELAECFPIGSEERNKNLCSANLTKVWTNKNFADIDISKENNPMWGKTHSEDTKKQIGEKSKKKNFTLEYKKKLSIAASGKNNPMWGKRHTELTRKKISDAQCGDKHHWYGTTRPDEVKKKIGLLQPSRKKIGKYDLNSNLIEVYDSMGIAAKSNNIEQGNLTTYLKSGGIKKNGSPKILGGYIWKEH